MNDKEWLKSLKEGDEIAIPGHGMSEGSYTEVIVQKITPTGKITVVAKKNPDYIKKFNENGRQIGGSKWDFVHLSPITEEMKAARVRKNILYKIKGTDWEQLPTDILKQVYLLVRENKENSEQS